MLERVSLSGQWSRRLFARSSLLVAIFLYQLAQRTTHSDASVGSVQGMVSAGNYSYYTLDQPGRVVLEMTSLSGDADLYASSHVKRPTYQLDKHEFQSSTCGFDKLEIDSWAPRPVYIGVYGHPSHDSSRFELTVFVYDPETSPFDQQGQSYTKMAQQHGEAPDTKAKRGKKDGHKEESASAAQVLIDVIGTILKFLLEILLEAL